MKKLFSVPSKTFLIGEYLATQGGTALIANTTPRFKLSLETKIGPAPLHQGIAETSPAGRFLYRYQADFAKFDLEFSDPHDGKGGLGASSAQYALLLYIYLSVVKAKKDVPGLAFSFLEEYISDSWSGVGIRPSGADMLAQIIGGLAVVATSTHCLFSLKWPFANLDFSLFRTGHKLATHEHLKNVGLIPKGILQEIADITIKGLKENNESIFLAGIKSYGETLAQFKLLADSSAALIKNIYAWPETLAAKGCGAMGADIILVVHRATSADAIKNKAAQIGLTFVSDAKSLSPGIQMQDIDKKDKSPEVRL